MRPEDHVGEVSKGKPLERVEFRPKRNLPVVFAQVGLRCDELEKLSDTSKETLGHLVARFSSIVETGFPEVLFGFFLELDA